MGQYLVSLRLSHVSIKPGDVFLYMDVSVSSISVEGYQILENSRKNIAEPPSNCKVTPNMLKLLLKWKPRTIFPLTLLTMEASIRLASHFRVSLPAHMHIYSGIHVPVSFLTELLFCVRGFKSQSKSFLFTVSIQIWNKDSSLSH